MKIPFLSSLLNLVFPKLCVCCGGVLMEGEENICLTCLYTLPRLNKLDYTNNKIMDIFLGRVKLEKAFSWCLFEKQNSVQNILHHIKYKDKEYLANQIGETLLTFKSGTPKSANCMARLLPVT